jgi:DNA invertase Pin-like site-specific DNA recombinase
VFEEKIAGAARKHPEIERLLGEVRKGDVPVVTRLDHLPRSTAELLIIAK